MEEKPYKRPVYKGAVQWHMSIPTRDQISRKDAELKRLWEDTITVDGKKLMTASEIRTFFMDMLAEGYELIPYGECDNFDKKHGCQGHPLEPQTDAAFADQSGLAPAT
jgi:hypothetical protein